MPAHAERHRLRQEIRRTVAERPGVYRLIDSYGQTVYVGKSVNMRNRLLSHFGSAGSRAQAYGTSKIETRETPTEFLALLLEDTLIKRELPRYNVQQAELADFRYLVLTSDPYPACRATEEPPPDALAAFGPFRNRFFAAEIIDVVTRTLGLRACADRKPFRRSANYDLGYCSGPCRDAISEAAYGEIVERVVAFLKGDDAEVTLRLTREISIRSEALDYERCAELESLVERYQRFCARQRFIEEFRSGEISLLDQNDGLRYAFANGSLITVTEVAEGKSSPAGFPVELSEPIADPRALLDRAAIVHGWLERHPATCEVKTLPVALADG